MRGELIDFGLESQDFLSTYFEKELYFRPKAFGTNLISWDVISTSLYSVDPASPNIKIYKKGQVPKVEYLENYQDGYAVASRFKPGKLHELLSTGSTLVMNKLDRYVERVGALTREVGDFTNSRTVANAYIAFSGEGTFGKHWDTHCVFALQLCGRKRWKVFKPTYPLPLDHQGSGRHKEECPDQPIFDHVLEAGDALYIPRGWWHEALPVADRDTLHIAVGIHTPKIHDYLCWIASNALAQEPELRKSWRRSTLSEQELQSITQSFLNAVVLENNQRVFMEKHAQLRVNQEAIDFAALIPKSA